MPRFDRRAALAVLVLALAGTFGAAIAQTDDPVAWVWSGGVTSRSAVVKARLEPRVEGASLVITDDGAAPEQALRIPAQADADGVVRFALQDLKPDTEYQYWVEVHGSTFAPGRVRTFGEGPFSFRIVFGSCARTGSNHSVFSAMESLEPLFFLHMGDFHYENIDTNDPALFRRAYERVLAADRQASLYRSAPIVYIWDDHDYGPNDSDRDNPAKPAALATYDQYVPHYPLEVVDGAIETLHQAFTAGRVRFLVTDVRSERTPDGEEDGPDKTLLGARQREWLVRELESAREDHALIVWVNVVPWITEPGSGHGWGRYDWERRWIADRIRSLGVAEKLLVLSGDGHMLALDDGTNSNFATDAEPGEPAFPVMHAAPLDRYPRIKGGPYSHGTRARRTLFGLIQVQQFGMMEIADDGELLEVTLSGRESDGDQVEGMFLRMACGNESCRVLREEETSEGAAILPLP